VAHLDAARQLPIALAMVAAQRAGCAGLPARRVATALNDLFLMIATPFARALTASLPEPNA